MNDLRFAEQTRDRVLIAAVEMFAQRGFRETTVREICAKAGVNTASVNYHFRNKSSLYKEALAFAFQQADRRYPLDDAKNADLSAEKRLTSFIRTFLHKLTDETNLGHHGRLIAREIADPTDALDEIIDRAIFPQFDLLRNLVPELLGQDWQEKDNTRFVLGILGQCLMYKHSRSVIDRICPEVIGNPAEIDKTAEHIARFSLAAFKQLSRESQR
ncbi:MAG: CerR family C-terminal domain-containing protein [Gammaproteobacteria bacterium]